MGREQTDYEKAPETAGELTLERIAAQLEELSARLGERDRELAAMRLELAHRDAQTTALAEKLAEAFAQVSVQRRRAEVAEGRLARLTGSRLFRPAFAVYRAASAAGRALAAPFRALAARLRSR